LAAANRPCERFRQRHASMGQIKPKPRSHPV
jgi:hypothetical protein